LSVTVTNFFTSPAPLWSKSSVVIEAKRDIEALYTLCVRLCRQIDAGTISVIEATEIFEAKRGRLIIQE
jgi:hypothetical protein